MKAHQEPSQIRCECGLVMDWVPYHPEGRQRVKCWNQQCPHFDKIFQLPRIEIELTEVPKEEC